MHLHSEIAIAYVLDTIATHKAPTVLVGIDHGTTADGVSFGHDPGPRTEKVYPSTPHGTAAALKAEAPQPDPHWLRAAMSESFGLDQCVDYHDYMAELRESQRRARKAANRRKARRGWR